MNAIVRVVFGLCVVGLLSSAWGAAERPNILYLYVDDLGWGAIGPNGQASRKAKGLPYVQTPHLDRLAAAGVNFTRGYGCTVCSPARSSQQTGFHQGHTFADRNDPDNAKKAMRAEDVLMGDVLSQAGYVTGYWGKWGYGASKDRKHPVILNTQTLPTSHGYQHVLAELHHVRAHTFFQPTLWQAPAEEGSLGGMALVRNTMQPYVSNPAFPSLPALQHHEDYPDTAYCDDAYAFAALEFVRTQAVHFRKTGQPFFGLLAVQVPHAPFGEIAQLPEWDRAYRGIPFFESLSDQAKQWAAMVTRIDHHFGNLLAALDDPNGDGDQSDSVAAETLVIFQSDNGGPQHNARREFAANGGLRGQKGQIYEGGIRVPTIMRWPSKINERSTLKRGSQSDLVVDVSDLMPTFCELAGIRPPVGLDGVSLVPTLTGDGVRRPREFLIHEAGRSQSIIRGRYKLIRTKDQLALYDLLTDPAESKDIAASNPVLVSEMGDLLLGERVTEPRGFANTYHHWRGNDGDKISKPEHWSDYVYANAGVVYQEDRGAPRLSWTAVIANESELPVVALGDASTKFLGLEIRGGQGSGAQQSLVLQEGIDLEGRNEIRISPRGRLVVNGGSVTSLRWIDVLGGGALEGFGRVASTVFNGGEVFVTVNDEAPDAGLVVEKDYRETVESVLKLIVGRSRNAPLSIKGDARLAGELRVQTDSDFVAVPGKVLTLLSARRIVGRFSNSNNTVVAKNGVRFRIRYTGPRVTLTVL